jgi:hypothetical protein
VKWFPWFGSLFEGRCAYQGCVCNLTYRSCSSSCCDSTKTNRPVLSTMPVGVEIGRTEKVRQLREDAVVKLEELLAMKMEEVSLLQEQLALLSKHHVRETIIVDPYGDRGLYTGQISNEKPNGKGTMKYEDGRVYVGEWSEGRWHGTGRATFSNGDSYDGNYRYDQRHGFGTYYWHDGRVYAGGFYADKRQGKGYVAFPWFVTTPDSFGLDIY